MTRKAGYPLGKAPGASGGAGGDVVDVRSALHPTTMHAPSLAPFMRRSQRCLTWHLGRQKASVGV